MQDQASSFQESPVGEGQAISKSGTGPPSADGLPTLLQDISSLLRELQTPALPAKVLLPPRVEPPPTLHRTPVAESDEETDRRRTARRRIIALVVVLAAGFILSPLVALNTPAKAYAIASGSMEPTIPKGSLVYASAGAIDEGDVIVYWSPLAGALEVHRVVEIRTDNSTAKYLTRGDANDAADSALVNSGDVRGVVRLVLPHAGRLWMAPQPFLVGGILGMVVLYLVLVAWDAGFRPSRVLQALLASSMVLLLVVPHASAAISPAFAPSTHTLAVATTPIPLSAGTMASATITDQNRASVTAAAPKLWKETVMWGCDPANLNSNPGCIHQPTAASYNTVSGSLIQVDVADYTPTPTFFLEAMLKAPAAGESTSVQLYDVTTGAAVGPEVVSSSTTVELLRSTSFTLSGSKEYRFQTKDSSAGSNGEVHMVKVIALQEFATKTITQVKISGAAESTSNNFVDVGRTVIFLYEGADLDGTITVKFEAVAQVPSGSGNGAQVRLATSGGTAVSTLDITNAMTTATRVISGALTLTNGQAYKVQFKDGGNGGNNRITLHLARLVIAQSSFTKTIRYEDLTWLTTVSTTTFTKVGYTGQYHMDSEWGGVSGYFEATLRNSNGGQTTTARLFDYTANAAVASSDVSSTGSSVTRVRSGSISLNVANGTYAVELKGSGTANAEARTAWIIVKQTALKSYDYAVRATNSVGSCTWDFTVEKTTDSNMNRLRGFKVSIRSGASTQDQVVWNGSSFTQTVGTAVSVAPAAALDIIVSTDPTTAGSSSVSASLKGTCGGVGTLQPLTLNLE